jgi:hypothetical protein
MTYFGISVELLYFDKIIREIEKALLEKKRLDFAAIEARLISEFRDFDWDFGKTLAKTGKYYPGKAVTPRLRKKKKQASCYFNPNISKKNE